MKNASQKKIVLIDNDLLDTNKITTISDQMNLSIDRVSINQFVINIQKYCDDLLLIPDIMIEIIDGYLKDFPTPNKQDTIILCSKLNNRYRIKQEPEQLNIIDTIDLNADKNILINAFNKQLSSEMNI